MAVCGGEQFESDKISTVYEADAESGVLAPLNAKLEPWWQAKLPLQSWGRVHPVWVQTKVTRHSGNCASQSFG